MAPHKHRNFIGYQGPSNLVVYIPDRIKCSRCDMVKSSSAFSNRQLDALKPYVARDTRFNPTLQAVIPCNLCTGAQRLEHTCSDCGKTKATDTGFTKAQLKRAEAAICIKCSDMIQGIGVGSRVKDDDGNAHDGDGGVDDGGSDDEDRDGSGKEFDDEHSDDDYDDWGSTMASGVTGRTGAGGVKIPSERQISFPSASASTVSKASGLPSGFNVNSYKKPAPSVGGGSLRGGNPGFAKIRKGQPQNDRVKQKVAHGVDEDEDNVLIHSDDSDF